MDVKKETWFLLASTTIVFVNLDWTSEVLFFRPTYTQLNIIIKQNEWHAINKDCLLHVIEHSLCMAQGHPESPTCHLVKPGN